MRLVFFGSGDIGLPTLRALLGSPAHEIVAVVTQPDRPVGRHQELRPTAIKTLARGAGVFVFQPERLRRDEHALKELRGLLADVFVVFAYGQILPKAVLEMPRLACLNIHASRLPRWRGAAPIQAAVSAGDPDTALTIMWMDEGLDTGDILLPGAPVVIGESESAGALHDRLADLAPPLLAESLELLDAGHAPRAPQDAALATHAPKLDRDAGRIDWTRDPFSLERHLRAMDPWPGAWTLVPTPTGPRGLKAFLGVPALVEGGPAGRGRPGEVLRADAHGVLVACGENGALRLKEVQLEGKRRMPAGDFLRGHALTPGTVLGG